VGRLVGLMVLSAAFLAACSSAGTASQSTTTMPTTPATTTPSTSPATTNAPKAPRATRKSPPSTAAPKPPPSTAAPKPPPAPTTTTDPLPGSDSNCQTGACEAAAACAAWGWVDPYVQESNNDDNPIYAVYAQNGSDNPNNPNAPQGQLNSPYTAMIGDASIAQSEDPSAYNLLEDDVTALDTDIGNLPGGSLEQAANDSETVGEECQSLGY
jgi:hypothetical protein